MSGAIRRIIDGVALFFPPSPTQENAFQYTPEQECNFQSAPECLICAMPGAECIDESICPHNHLRTDEQA